MERQLEHHIEPGYVQLQGENTKLTCSSCGQEIGIYTDMDIMFKNIVILLFSYRGIKVTLKCNHCKGLITIDLSQRKISQKIVC